MLDMKDAHVIVRLVNATDLETRDGRIEYGVIDYELMERTAEYEKEVREDRRQAYLRRRRRVWHEEKGPRRPPPALPAHLDSARILGVDYVHGRTESTGGALWVVGRDPRLFDLFLPERWRTTPQLPLPPSRETWSTESKDHVRLVWKVSSVGERPEIATRGAVRLSSPRLRRQQPLRGGRPGSLAPRPGCPDGASVGGLPDGPPLPAARLALRHEPLPEPRRSSG